MVTLAIHRSFGHTTQIFAVTSAPRSMTTAVEVPLNEFKLVHKIQQSQHARNPVLLRNASNNGILLDRHRAGYERSTSKEQVSSLLPPKPCKDELKAEDEIDMVSTMIAGPHNSVIGGLPPTNPSFEMAYFLKNTGPSPHRENGDEVSRRVLSKPRATLQSIKKVYRRSARPNTPAKTTCVKTSSIPLTVGIR
jgi:hypothetical protein